jgi:PAS domain S-box-containing protein
VSARGNVATPSTCECRKAVAAINKAGGDREERLLRDTPLLERLYIDPKFVRPGSASAYILAGVVIAAATAMRMAIDPYVTGIQFIFLSFGIMIATYVCGVRAGVFSCVAAVLAAWFFILPVRFSFRIEDPAQINNLISFALIAAADVTIVALLRASLAHSIGLRAFDLAIFNSNPDAIIVADTAGLIIRVNERAVTMFGYPRDALIGQPVEMLIPDRFRTRHEGHRKAFESDRRAREMGAGLDLLARRANGEEFPVDVQIGPVREDDESRVIVNIRDVTDVRAAAAALVAIRRQQAILEGLQRGADELQQANAKLSKVIESAPVAIWAIDAEERFTIWNPAVEKIYGIAAADAIGRSWREIASGRVPDNARSSEDVLRAALEQGGFQNVEIQRTAVDGSNRELSLSTAVLRNANDQHAGILFIARDIGETKELEQKLRQAQKMEVVGQLTGGVAHDFNNLLAVIYGNLELLIEHGESDPLVMELAGDALNAAQHGASLTHQLLAFSRQQQLAPSAVNIGTLVSNTIGMLRRVVEESTEIITAVPPDIWQSQIDSQQLVNALLNLVINARDAMPTGGTVTISAENAILESDYTDQYAEVMPGRYVKLIVADTGTGMPKDVLARATEPFFTTKEVGSGSGLGLSMVYGFIKQSGGHLTLYSEPGHGTVVNLYLPQLPSDAAAAAIEDTKPHPVASDDQLIVVVEDDGALRKLQIRMLNSLGYRTLDAGDGRSALHLLGRVDSVDLLLTDIVLPGGMNGPALAEAARRLKPNLKVIFMSGYAPNDVRQSHDISATQCLSKPFTRSELAHAVQLEFSARPTASFEVPESDPGIPDRCHD